MDVLTDGTIDVRGWSNHWTQVGGSYIEIRSSHTVSLGSLWVWQR
jgi:hypothetical protein